MCRFPMRSWPRETQSRRPCSSSTTKCGCPTCDWARRTWPLSSTFWKLRMRLLKRDRMLIITIAPMKKITAARTDSSDLPVVASGPFVSHRDLRELYENATVDLVFLDGVLSSGRLDALENGAPLTASEKALLVRRRLKMFFDEPVADDAYVIKSLATAAGHKVFRAETRSWRR